MLALKCQEIENDFTVAMLMKAAVSIQKLFFDPAHYGTSHQKKSICTTYCGEKFLKLSAISKSEATIQEHSLLARVR